MYVLPLRARPRSRAYMGIVCKQFPYRVCMPCLLRRRLQWHQLRICRSGIRPRMLVRAIPLLVFLSLERQRLPFCVQRKLLGALRWPTRHFSIQHDFRLQDWYRLESRKWCAVVWHCGCCDASLRGLVVRYDRKNMELSKSGIKI